MGLVSGGARFPAFVDLTVELKTCFVHAPSIPPKLRPMHPKPPLVTPTSQDQLGLNTQQIIKGGLFALNTWTYDQCQLKSHVNNQLNSFFFFLLLSAIIVKYHLYKMKRKMVAPAAFWL